MKTVKSLIDRYKMYYKESTLIGKILFVLACVICKLVPGDIIWFSLLTKWVLWDTKRRKEQA